MTALSMKRQTSILSELNRFTNLQFANEYQIFLLELFLCMMYCTNYHNTKDNGSSDQKIASHYKCVMKRKDKEKLGKFVVYGC